MKASGFRFYNPVKLICGVTALDSLPYELKQLQCRKPLIITDQGVVKAGLIDLVKKAVGTADQITVSIYDQVPPDSSPAVVNEAAAVFREDECDSVIAVGGGSVIDTGKAVNIVISEEADDIILLLGVKLRGTMKPFIAIPTTAGTGSEVTYAAMIKDAAQNQKLLFASFQLFPDTAILDPRMTVSLPRLVTAATAMDAMSHAMEAYICNQKNPISDAHGFSAIKLIRENLLRALADGGDMDARFYLAVAACMAGTAFSNSGVGVVHAMGHALGGICGVSHGVAMNIFLPHALEFNLATAPDAIGEMLMPLAGPEEYVHTAPQGRAAKTVAAIQELKEKLYEMAKLPRTLSEAGVQKNSLESVARKALQDPAINFNPVAVSYDDVRDILQSAF